MPRFSDAEINRLVRFYEDAEREILNRINRALLRGNQTEYLAEMKRNIEAILQRLREGNRTWCPEAIARVYSEGLKNADALLKDTGTSISAGFGAIHQQAAQVLAENAFQRFEDVVQVIGRQVNDIYRELALENVRGTVVGYDTWKQTARKFREQLAERGVTGFKDRSGRMWNMRTYTEMVARTTTAEAHLQGTANRLVEQGHDLVKVSTHHGSCELCQPWQGKILSITGKTKGYPTLEEAKAAGLFHPNCRHAYGLYIDLDKEIEDMDREEEKILGEEKYANAPEYVKKIHKIKEAFDSKKSLSMADISKAGEILRKEMIKGLPQLTRKQAIDQYDKAKKLYDSLRVNIYRMENSKPVHSRYAGRSLESLQEEFKETKVLLDKLKTFIQTGKDTPEGILLDKLKGVREMGTSSIKDPKSQFQHGSNTEAVEAVRRAMECYPTSWMEKSIDHGKLSISRVSRGFYRHDSGREGVSELAISGNLDAVAIHEMGHRLERIIPDILKLEKAFYKKRTKGEDLQWLGGAYDKSEMARFDKFLNPYMGKDYGGRAYELVSMGFEMAYTRPDELFKDEEYADFILGILALID